MDPQLSQQDLAAWIDREGLAFEVRMRKSGELRKDTWYQVPGEAHQYPSGIYGYEIRLAPGALNEWNLPHGVAPHNPDKLTPEQITEGGLYRAVTLEECDGRHEEVCEVWVPSSDKFLLAGAGCHAGYTYRVPITTPLPKSPVKESLTHQPAPDACYVCDICHKPVPDYEPQFCCSGYDCGCMGYPIEPCVCSSECNDALFKHIGKPMEQRRIEAGIALWQPAPDVAQSATPEDRLDQVFLAAFGTNDPAMLDWVAIKFKLKELTAALAERDEARRLLGVAHKALESAQLCLHGHRHYEASYKEVTEARTQITNHLNNTK